MSTTPKLVTDGAAPLPHAKPAGGRPVASHGVPSCLPGAQAGPLRRLIVLLTGAMLGGIGHAILLALTRLGHTVIVVERNWEAGRQAVGDARRQGGDAWLAHLDASDETLIGRLMGLIKCRWGRLDAVINNAGWSGTGSALRDTLVDLDASAFAALLKANLVSAFVVTRAALREFFLRQPEMGVCIYLGSTNGQPGNGTQVGYACAKTGLSALVRVGATQYGCHCRFLLLRPGLVETDSAGWRERRVKDEHYASKEGVKVPLGRLARPAEIAALIPFLLSPEASYLQGCEINCDGGLTASGQLLPGGASTSRDAYVELMRLVERATNKKVA